MEQVHSDSCSWFKNWHSYLWRQWSPKALVMSSQGYGNLASVLKHASPRVFFFSYLIYLKGKKTDKTEIPHSPNAPNSQGQPGQSQEPRARNSIWVSHGGGRVPTRVMTLLLSRLHISKELGLAAKPGLNHSTVMGWGRPNTVLTAINTHLEVLFFN